MIHSFYLDLIATFCTIITKLQTQNKYCNRKNVNFILKLLKYCKAVGFYESMILNKTRTFQNYFKAQLEMKMSKIIKYYKL
jgi:hypothetical protein